MKIYMKCDLLLLVGVVAAKNLEYGAKFFETKVFLNRVFIVNLEFRICFCYGFDTSKRCCERSCFGRTITFFYYIL